jgi:hypothetical protein
MTEILRYAAFTRDGIGGNPAGVVLDAGDLDDGQMLAIAQTWATPRPRSSYPPPATHTRPTSATSVRSPRSRSVDTPPWQPQSRSPTVTAADAGTSRRSQDR